MLGGYIEEGGEVIPSKGTVLSTGCWTYEDFDGPPRRVWDQGTWDGEVI